MNGEPYAGANTVASPPMCTLRAGLRACWMNSRGAVRCTSARHRPRGKRTRSPSTSAPAAFQICSASGSSRKIEADLLEDRVGVALDEAQALLVQHLEARQRASDVGHGGSGAGRTGGALGIASARAHAALGSRFRFVHSGHVSSPRPAQAPSMATVTPAGGSVCVTDLPARVMDMPGRRGEPQTRRHAA